MVPGTFCVAVNPVPLPTVVSIVPRPVAFQPMPATPLLERTSVHTCPSTPAAMPGLSHEPPRLSSCVQLAPLSTERVMMTLVARDEANNEGRSTPHEFKLPQRPFYKTLARALVEQRRNLALDAEARARVLASIDALTIAPERFIPETNVYLGLRSIYWQLSRAESDDAKTLTAE